MENERFYSRGHAVFLTNLPLRIDIDLHESDPSRLRFRARQALEDRRDRLTGSAPVGIEVNHEIRRAVEELAEMRWRGDVRNRHLGVYLRNDFGVGAVERGFREDRNRR